MKVYIGLFGRNKLDIIDQIIVTASNYEEAKQLLYDESNYYNYNKIVEVKLSDKCKVTMFLNNVNIKYF